MFPLSLSLNGREINRILCLGAHCDDIEIGCGGTILALSENSALLGVTWVVFSSDRERGPEATESAESFLAKTKEKTIRIENFRDGFFPYVGATLKEYFEQLKEVCSPDLIFTHYRNDLHQDHRTISELTWNTFRNHLILEYEIPKYDGDVGSPNLFVPLEGDTCGRKIEYILKFYRSQAEKHWFGQDLFMSVLRLRGMEANAPTGYAEGFYCRKAVLGTAV